MKARSIGIGVTRDRVLGDTRDRWLDGHSATFSLSVIDVSVVEEGLVEYTLVWRHTCDRCGLLEERQHLTWSGHYLIEWEDEDAG